jgi:hypothetical protein
MAKRTITCELTVIITKKFPFPDTDVPSEIDNIKDLILDSMGYPDEDKVQITITNLRILTGD